MWREHFNRKAADHQGSPMASDFSEKGFRDTRAATRSARATEPLTWLSTSFAIRGRRPPASATGSAAR